ncbi:MAG: hypothetical protein HQ581_21595 [Planctomycetes bacterium]|nr:hypothetical protein [Planctomycetota bacterium]
MKVPALVAVFCLLLASNALAVVTTVGLWRLGDDDPTAIDGGSATTGTFGRAVAGSNLNLANSGSANTQTYTTSTPWPGSTFATTFDGNDGYWAPTVPSVSQDNFGIEAWVKAGNGTDPLGFVTNNGLLGSGWGIVQAGGTIRGHYQGGGDIGSAMVTPGVWTHYALVRDNGTATLYVNGVPSGATSAATPITPGGVLEIGYIHRSGVGDQSWFQGAIDHVRVFEFKPGQFDPATDLSLSPTSVPKPGSVIVVPSVPNIAASNLPVSVLSDWQSEYESLRTEIASARATPPTKTTAHHSTDDKILDKQALIWDTDRSPRDVAFRRTGALLQYLKNMPDGPDVSSWEKRLREIRDRGNGSTLAKTSAISEAEDQSSFFALKQVAREAAFSNPLLDFDDVLFVERKVYGKSDQGGQHQVTQYYGHTQMFGGGLYVIKDFKSASPTVVNLLENAVVQEGRLKGQKLAGGAFHSPELSFDGQEILFSHTQPCGRIANWRPNNRELWTADNCFHIFSVNADGSNLVQLTDGPWNDVDPCFLPNGRIAFISERITGRGEGHMFNRCFTTYAPQSLLHSMKADGSDMFPLSWFENDEYQPSVNNDGMLVYTRWDYVDRDAAIAQHLWSCYPDGRDPRSAHGNYPHPYSTMPGAEWDGVRLFPHGSSYDGGYFTDKRPFAEWDIRAIPGSHKYIATAGPHHGDPYGSLVVIDTRMEDDGYDSQIARLTPGKFPEAEETWPSRESTWLYGTAWPLSEAFHLVNYRDGIYLLDKFGNKTLIVKAQNGALRPVSPIPLTSRTEPPVIPTATHQGERLRPESPNATISIVNNYISDLPLPADVKLKELRIIQFIPKSGDFYSGIDLGYAPQGLGRMVLGTVPIEADGSAYFEAPVGKALSFQILDDKGMAVQLMRSITYVHPGEQMTCVGCHESKWESPPIAPGPIAMQWPPSKIEPEVGGVEPVNFYRLVKPVLDKHCTACHLSKKVAPDMSYNSLEPYAFYTAGGTVRAGGGFGAFTWARHGGSRSIPMKHGAYGAILYQGGYLGNSHYDVNMSAEELRRITLWLDCNSMEMGVYGDPAAQKRGELVWPAVDFDPDNLLGVETRGDGP